MKKAHELPQAVNNLRAIWDKKKVEMKFTQVEAAAKLGWSQGAISHYLNNITELGPAAVVKFANFLGVDPLEIDPSVISHLPNTRALKITRNTSNFSKHINQTYYHSEATTEFRVVIDPSVLIFEEGDERHGLGFAKEGETCICTLCDVKELPAASYFIIQKKGEKAGHFHHWQAVPDKKEIKSIYAVSEMFMLSSTALKGPYK